MKKKQSLLELPLEVSRLIDTLCLEAVLTCSDETSLGLLEMLGWLTDQTVSREQFSQLYSAWCQAKPLPDVLASCQEEALGKQLTAQSLPHSEEKLRHIVEVLQEEYTAMLLLQHYSQSLASKLPLIRNIFALLDPSNVGHLRRSDLLLLLEAMTVLGIAKLGNPPSAQNILERLVQLERQFCGIDGVLTYRNLSNGLLNKQLSVSQLQELLTHLGRAKPKRVFECAMSKWKTTPRFFKRKIDRYMRVFEEHDWLFLAVDPDPYEIEAALQRFYGKQFLVLADIDFVVVREFLDLLKKELCERLKHLPSSQQPSNNRSVSTRKREVQTPKSNSARKHHKESRSTTKPQKNAKARQVPNLALTATPKKLSSTISTTPKRQWQPEVLRSVRQTTTFSKKGSQEDQPNGQAHDLRSKKSPINGGTATSQHAFDEENGKPNFFKNRRVQSFEVVMRRLRSKRA